MMLNAPIYNFSAGPAVLPESVLKTAQYEMLDYHGTGLSVMSMSHRSPEFESILYHAEQDLRQLMGIPNHYKVLFLQGGASAQFSQIAMNLASGFERIDSVVTGNWSKIAHSQMALSTRAKVHLAAHGGEQFQYLDLPQVKEWDIDKNSAFVHFAINETVDGLQYDVVPKLSDGMPALVCDMSSEILSRQINVADFGLIYAGAQKNLGPAGVTIVIVRDDLLERCPKNIPNVWNYQQHVDKQGMYNTPATYPIYITGLVLRWLQTQGGVAAIEKINNRKAQMLYQAIDESGGFYINPIAMRARSKMNVIFKTATTELDKKFIEEAKWHGLKQLAGYKTVGGMRASIYNAMPLEGVETLITFMQEFQAKYEV